MLTEAAVFFWFAYSTDSLAAAELLRQTDPNFNDSVLQNLDSDVAAERDRTLGKATSILDIESKGNIAVPPAAANAPLVIERLRKVFPPKRQNGQPIVATQDVAFTVNSGEIFGLLGANGAGLVMNLGCAFIILYIGKTTTLSMLTRHLVPTAGDAFVVGHSILNEFSKGATHMGVVTQNNSLWDLLSVENHLYLFAR